MEVKNREYHSWNSDRIIIDTPSKTAEESFQELKEKINENRKDY